jgi:Ca2+-binding RTX toxin-like protein
MDGEIDTRITIAGDYELEHFNVRWTDIGLQISYGDPQPLHASQIVGTEVDEELVGTDGPDLIRGVAGNNVLEGGPGDDFIFGGSGDDVLHGGPGNDRMIVFTGTNILRGGPGDDVLESRSRGHGLLDGGEDDDLLFGINGPTTYLFAPGWGNDLIFEFDDSADGKGHVDVIHFSIGIGPEDIDFQVLNEEDLLIERIGGQDTILVLGQFGANPAKQVERMTFEDMPGWYLDLTEPEAFELLPAGEPNQAPIARNATFVARTGIALGTSNVLAGDEDPNGDPIEVVGLAYAGPGDLSVRATGEFEYLPAPQFVGTDQFTYTIRDSFGAEASATVFLNVPNEAPIARDDSFDARFGIAIGDAHLLANDEDPDGDAIQVVSFSYGGNGTLAVFPDGGFSYQPAFGFTGIDEFLYTIEDTFGATASATAFLNVANEAPIARDDRFDATVGVGLGTANVLDNDEDPDGDPFTLIGFRYEGGGTLIVSTTGIFAYTPPPGFSGVDTYTYTIRDDFGAESSAVVELAVGVVDEPEPSLVLPEPTLVGTVGRDRLVGTDGNDVILSLGGDDMIFAGAGDDVVVFDGPGRPQVHGGAGADLFVLYGAGSTPIMYDFDAAAGDRLDIADPAFRKGGAVDLTLLSLSQAGSFTLLSGRIGSDDVPLATLRGIGETDLATLFGVADDALVV